MFKLKTHFPTVEKARAITDNFINRWEIVTGLQQNPGDLRFIYASADIIDLEPDEFDGVTSNLNVTLSDVVLVSEAVTIQIGRGEYPSLPQTLQFHQIWKSCINGIKHSGKTERV